MSRYATTADIPHIVEMARREHALSAWAEQAFDAGHVRSVAKGFIQGYGRTLLVTEGGYLAGLVQSTGFTSRLHALEYAWFAEDGKGMELLSGFEKWAASMNADYVIAHDYTGQNRLAAVLTRKRGYKRLGFAVTKKLEH